MNLPHKSQTQGNAMPLNVTFASQAEPGDRVEGFGTVVEVVEVTDKTATIVYEPFRANQRSSPTTSSARPPHHSPTAQQTNRSTAPREPGMRKMIGTQDNLSRSVTPAERHSPR